jgi:hypothetical protein
MVTPREMVAGVDSAQKGSGSYTHGTISSHGRVYTASPDLTDSSCLGVYILRRGFNTLNVDKPVEVRLGDAPGAREA